MTHVMLALTCNPLVFCDFDREEIREGENHLGDRYPPQARGSFKWHVLRPRWVKEVPLASLLYRELVTLMFL